MRLNQEHDKRLFAENILLLIIAVSLLAVKLSDGFMTEVTNLPALPFKEKPAAVVQRSSAVPGVAAEKTKKLSSSRVAFCFTLEDLNKLSKEELTQINGIGPVLAQRIVDYRKAHSKFKKISELKRIKGIGEKKYAAIMKQYR